MNNIVTQKMPIIGFSIGDFNGIGVEVFLKMLAQHRWEDQYKIVFFGSPHILSFYSALCQIEIPQIIFFENYDKVEKSTINIPSIYNEPSFQQYDISPGKPDIATAALTFHALESATEAAIHGFISGIVTLPINKDILQHQAFDFPGHTEYLCSKTGSDEVLMLMCHNQLKVGTITGHIPISQVPHMISKSLIIDKVKILYSTLKTKFKIQNPSIALLGLNPHAGENGKLGNEEKEILIPLIQQFNSKKINEKINVEGPFPADGFFGNKDYKHYDAVLSMYHDQGLIPFKLLAFQSGVNYTCGLPFPRTSPGHGTAYSIAGKNIANEQSLVAATTLLLQLV